MTFPFFGLYGASKFAVEALTDSYRYEVSQLGIDVALVQPSASATPPADTGRAAEYGTLALEDLLVGVENEDGSSLLFQ